MNLGTRYLGLKLKNPFMPGASPLVDNLDNVRRLEDAGASAMVLHSLFEEQLSSEDRVVERHVERHALSFAEAPSFLPGGDEFALTPDSYLEHLRRIKEAVAVPVIASLNGVTQGGWVEYARLMEEAGADALELNYYHLSTDPREDALDVESRAVEILGAVKEGVSIPVAVKLSPFFSALPNFARRLEKAGAAGLVLFNRFYQPDINVEELDVTPTLSLSDPSELRLRLRWLAIVSASVECSLAASGGVHTGLDAVKAIMTGAHAVQLVSALLRHGPERLKTVLDETGRWLEEHEYESVEQLRGSMSLAHCPDPQAFERANYLRVLQGWRI